jgi:hypothetical protein
MSKNIDSWEQIVEQKTHRTIAQLQNETISECRARVEAERGAPMRFPRMFPLIGRGGNQMGEFILTRKQVDEQVDWALR